MADLLELYPRAVEEFGRRVQAVRGDQWGLPTPDDGWDVRDLVQHLVAEQLWAPPLLGGATIAEVGDRFDGDLLGDDPRGAWEAATRGALDAVDGPGVLARTVHVSFGDISGEEYLTQLTNDHTIHAWDLARAIGADERLDPDLVEFAIATLSPGIDEYRAAGAFGPQVSVPAGASRQDEMLALSGRTP